MGSVRFLAASLVIGISLVIAVPAGSLEPAPTDSLTLKECVAIALRNNADIINSRYNVDIQDLSLQVVKGNLLPTISTSYGANKNITGPQSGQVLDPSTQQVVTSTGQSRTSGAQSVGTSFSVPIYNAATLSSIGASRANLRSFEQTLETQRLTTVQQVKQRFFQVFRSEKQLDLSLESVRTAEESLRRAQTMYEIGSAPVSDVYTARSGLESRKVTVITQQNAVDIARSNLAFTLGLDVNQPLRLKESSLVIKPLDFSYDQAYRRALEHRPNLKARKFGLEQIRKNLEGTRAGMRRPSASLSAGYSWGTANTPFRGLEDLFLQNYNYSLSFNVSMPIFNGLRNETQVRQSRLQLAQSMELLRRDERQVALDVKQAMLNLDRFRQQIDAQQEAVKAAEEDFRTAEERYNFGSGTILERLQAQERLFSAKNQYISAIYDYQGALADLESAIGQLEE